MNRILIVDDEATFRHFLYRVLSDTGYTIIEACCGDQARRILYESAVALVITDLAMPDGDGIELLMACHEQYPALPVVVVSGAIDTTTDAFQRLCEVYGVRKILAKPF